MTRDSYDGLLDDRQELHAQRKQRRLIFAITLLVGFILVLGAVFLMWNHLFPAEVPAMVQSEAAPLPAQAATAQIQTVENAPVIAKESTAVEIPKATPEIPITTAISLDEAPKVASRSFRNAVQFEKHTVKEGESLDDIASSYGLKPQTLISVNQIRNINALREGSVLSIPDRDGQIYTVKSGDMLSTIARSFNMGWQKLMEVNDLTSDMIRPGQELFIPDASSQGGTLAHYADVATVSFQKPATGRVVQTFLQSASDPVDRDGILMEGLWGDAVFCGADGDVVDVGMEIQGRGRFVVISHADGYKTTYAHLESVDVRIGDKVSRGQMIGIIGTSGTTWDNPRLFFKLEQSGYALDPSNFI